jgi:TRAP-type C4-dicarboxylate transport system permease small subunit
MMEALTSSVQYFALTCSNKTSLFGIPSWYSYLDLQVNSVTNTCDIVNFSVPGSFINVGLAILDMALHLAALVAVGFVIYGGFMLVTSRGEPDKAAQARQAIINALVGLVITLIAVGVVGFLGTKLG